VTLCPNCGVALAYEGQRHCAACGADLSATMAAPTQPAQPTAPTAPTRPTDSAAPDSAAPDSAPALDASAPAAPDYAPALDASAPAAPDYASAPAAPDYASAPAAPDYAPDPSGQPMPSAPAPTAWHPTHRASMFGQPAWDQPDPSSQPSVMLPAGLELLLTQTYGYWAQVQAENGWHGWVDSQQLAAMPWMNPTSMSPAGTRRGKVLLVLGVVALIVVLVGAGLLAVGASQVSSVPVDGNWSGIETGHTAQKLLVEFTVTGRQAGQVTIAFWDPSDAFFEWTCADSTIVNGKFTAEQCLSNFGGDVLTVDVSGTFASSQEIDGQYSVTVNGTPYSGDWWGSPN
jgi:hypothetical protein